MPFDLKMPASMLDLGTVVGLRRKRLVRLQEASETVGDMIAAARSGDRALIRDLAERATLAPGPSQDRDPASPPPLGADRERWLAWARRHHVEHLAESVAADWYQPWSHGIPPRRWKVVDLLCGAFVPKASRYGWNAGPTVEQFRDHLAATATHVASALERERRLEPTRRTPPDPALAAAWRELLRRREALRERVYSIPLHPVELSADPEGLELVAGFRTSPRVEDARLRLDPLDLKHPEDPALALPLVDALLDWITGPEAEDDREEIVAELRSEPWERALRRLERAVLPPELPEHEDKRLLGFEVELGRACTVRPVQCRPKKRGAGYLTRRVEPARVPAALRLEAREGRVVALLEAGGDAATAAALGLLVGHPRVFLAGTGEPIPVRGGRLSLGLRASAEHGSIRIVPQLDGVEHAPADLLERVARVPGHLVDTLTGSLRLTPCSEAAERAVHALARSLPEVPPDRLDRLVQRLPELSAAVPLASDSPALGRPVPGDERLVVALRWEQGTLAVAARVQPLPESPPEVPGEGASVVFARRGERVVHLPRDLATEPSRALRALAPLELADADRGAGPFDWVIGDPQRALGFLERLRETPNLRVVWEGDRLRLSDRPADAKDLSLRIASGRDWFGLGGELKVEGAKVDLAALLRAALAGHRYVELGKHHWVALDEALRASLAAAASSAHAEDGPPRLGPLHAPLVEGLAAAGAQVDAPPEWVSASDRLRRSATLEVELPEGLRADLRDYQLAGFTWLARLAHWAPGAVLADDMGLGKTLQAIALLLRRAELGPALVVAPTSVVSNWERELARFAPELSVVPYRGPGRARALEGLAPGQVLLATYGVLGLDAEALAGASFATAILDESQAIKNAEAQRSRAAHALRADFRVALSGTPVENRVSELYSLFAFVAPGLLGSRRHFVEHFVQPIELRGDTGRRAAVAALVAPFLLRRTKAEVATELPPRTEVTVRVELGDDERAVYERTRLESVARVAAAGPRRAFQILEELTRLRRQACHPRLADPGSEVASAKQKTAMRLLADLREGGHRALVFSNFVGHLALIREALEAEGFVVRYLDGQLPERRRREEVDAFQAGLGDVFLISLKAGGVGLNLTAADYVLLLDPWWNPASEDQASDRAHRIGQDKPVTVYRLVTAGTVEEEIVALHAHKRELAEALLSGAGSTRMPSAEELMGLLMGSRGDEQALAELERVGRPKLRLVEAPAP